MSIDNPSNRYLGVLEANLGSYQGSVDVYDLGGSYFVREVRPDGEEGTFEHTIPYNRVDVDILTGQITQNDRFFEKDEIEGLLLKLVQV